MGQKAKPPEESGVFISQDLFSAGKEGPLGVVKDFVR